MKPDKQIVPTSPGWWMRYRDNSYSCITCVVVGINQSNELRMWFAGKRDSQPVESDGLWVAEILMPQPPPSPGEGDIWLELLETETDPTLRQWYISRRTHGIASYGTPLQRGNGRDYTRDLCEELLDAMAYAQADNHRWLVTFIREWLRMAANGWLREMSDRMNVRLDNAEKLEEARKAKEKDESPSLLFRLSIAFFAGAVVAIILKLLGGT